MAIVQIGHAMQRLRLVHGRGTLGFQRKEHGRALNKNIMSNTTNQDIQCYLKS